MKLVYLKETMKTWIDYYKKRNNQEKVEEIKQRIANLPKK